jgi:WD40 repeat protein
LITYHFYFLFFENLQILDARVPDGVVREICNHSIIHSTYMFRHGDFIMSADHQGLLKTWDTGTGRVVHEFETDSARSTPISHIAVCEPRESEEEGRLLAVNCWDNVLRVYNRGKSLEHFYASAPSPAPSVTPSSSMVPAATSASSDPNHTDSLAAANFGIASASLSPFNLTPIHECRSHRNKSWPIKSSFFLGADYHGKSNWRPLGLTDAQDRSASAPLRNDVDLMDPMSWRSTANVNLSAFVF